MPWEAGLPGAPIGLDALLAGLLRPDPGALGEAVPLLAETLAMALGAAIIALILAGCVTAMLRSRALPALPVKILRAALVMLGGLPCLALAALLVLAIGPGYPAGLSAIALSGVPFLALRFAATLAGVDATLANALDSAGAARVQRLRFGLWPQIAPELGATLGEWLTRAVSQAVLVGIVGAGGLGAMLFSAIGTGAVGKAATVLLLIMVTTLALSLIAAAMGWPGPFWDRASTPPAAPPTAPPVTPPVTPPPLDRRPSPRRLRRSRRD
ncbi:MAG: ABC transporter permease subunit [Pseudomonadota bacterium]